MASFCVTGIHRSKQVQNAIDFGKDTLEIAKKTIIDHHIIKLLEQD